MVGIHIEMMGVTFGVVIAYCLESSEGRRL